MDVLEQSHRRRLWEVCKLSSPMLFQIVKNLLILQSLVDYYQVAYTQSLDQTILRRYFLRVSDKAHEADCRSALFGG